ncbi:sialate O-acetylesterase [Coraliomargarita parva]|uniref:sialate O-acetylesterase n=1 Tax=Coraliomargarita parva TaxID=3014050 RepID=UPI0022B4D97A|nr:sialate O-acetylesterase [Coraliomargarita parva]
MKSKALILIAVLGAIATSHAEIKMPSIFGHRMVLQRDMQTPIWGTADPGEEVIVEIGEQRHQTQADAQGAWKVLLTPMPAGGPYLLKVKGKNTLTFNDVLMGDIWICAGQSNMQWPVMYSKNAPLEIATANYPEIRLLTFPVQGRQEPQIYFKETWQACTPRSAKAFSGVGYFFGRDIHKATNVPIGLVDISWGSSAIESWIDRETLEATGVSDEYIATKEKRAAEYTDEEHAKRVAEYRTNMEEWKQTKSGQRPEPPKDPRYNQYRPANIYNGMLYGAIGYGIKGAIWYQGESNARNAEAYHTLFPTMIEMMREDWDQGDFPFYWVQLTSFRFQPKEPGNDSWARLREAQTMTLDKLPNVGQAVTLDAGEVYTIHPEDKQTVAHRLARLALAKDYGFNEIPCESPRFKSMEIQGSKALLTFDHVDKGLHAYDSKEVKGFAIAGEDMNFVWADAKVTGKDSIEVWSDSIKAPVAVRYAWAQNPDANVRDRNSLLLTPFRTDD